MESDFIAVAGGAVEARRFTATAWRLGLLKIWLLLLGIAGCNREQPPPPAAPPPGVTVALARRAQVPVTVELPGRTNAYRVAQVRARVDGIVLKRDFTQGADVKAGQRLYQIDPSPYRADLASAQADLGKARANVAAVRAQAARYEQLVETAAVSKQEYDNAVSSLGQALADVRAGEALVQAASINLGYTNVTAPITGRVGIAQVTEGAYVQASAATLMTTVQQMDPIYVDLSQSSVQGLRLRQSIESGHAQTAGPRQAKVTVLLEDGTQYPIAGTVQFTDITVDPNTGSVTVRAIVPNPRHILLPGMFVRGRIEAGVEENVLLVPQAGVTHDPQGQATVLLVGPGNRVVQRTVQAPRTYGADWVVTGGLNEGDRVIVSGMQKARPGAPVRVTAQLPITPNPASQPPPEAAAPKARADR
jgi:membrane fusion protein (multidrug efflux system)